MIQGEEAEFVNEIKAREDQIHSIRLEDGMIISVTKEEYEKLEAIAQEQGVSLFSLLRDE